MKKKQNLVMLDYFKMLNEKLQKDKNIKEDIFSNYDYISWLEKFTLLNQFFRLDHLIYDANKLSKEDFENAEKLELFFEGIEEYATEVGIAPESCGAGPTYGIKYNEVGYYIASMAGQGVTYLCKRTEIDDDSFFIEFSDIVNKNKSKKLKKSI